MLYRHKKSCPFFTSSYSMTVKSFGHVNSCDDGFEFWAAFSTSWKLHRERQSKIFVEKLSESERGQDLRSVTIPNQRRKHAKMSSHQTSMVSVCIFSTSQNIHDSLQGNGRRHVALFIALFIKIRKHRRNNECK